MFRRATTISSVIAVAAWMHLASGYAQEPAEPVRLPLLPAEQAWLVALPAPPAAGGTMDADRIYVPLQSGQLLALHRHTGEQAWTQSIQTRWSPHVLNGLVVVAAADALVAIEGDTGNVRWRVALEQAPAAPLETAPDRIVLASDTGVTVLRASDGSQLWHQPMSAAPRSAGVSNDGRIALGLADGRIVALDLADGRQQWEQHLSGMPGQPVLGRDRVFVGSTDNHLYALDGSTGALRWRWRAGGDVVGVAAAGDTVFFVALDNLVRALNRGNGNQRWKTEAAGRPAGPLLVHDRTLLVTDLSPGVTALDSETGVAAGSLVAPGDLAGQPLVDPDTPANGVAIALITLDGRVAGLRPTGPQAPKPESPETSEASQPAPAP